MNCTPDDSAAKGGLEWKRVEESVMGRSEAEALWREIKAEMAAGAAGAVTGNNAAMIRIREGRQWLNMAICSFGVNLS